MSKRVLFINPAKTDNFTVDRIHMGLSLLGHILVGEGCDVKVVDYAYLRGIQDKFKTPRIEDIIRDFRPDVVGVSVFTYLYKESAELLDTISKFNDAPVIVGGPHVTFFPQDFGKDSRVSYIVRGEAELIISDIVGSAKKQFPPAVINSPLPPAEKIPAVNLDICEGASHCTCFQIQLSRGCPFDCSFCNIEQVAGHKVRARDLDPCVEEIAEAIRKYPSIRSVVITDDCPNFNKERFKRFLTIFAARIRGRALTIDNVRADLLDEEMLKLYLKAGGRNICVGAESGYPEVFMLVNKGESIDKISAAARLIRKHNISLGLCFVIGLPEDSPERHKYSVKLARELKPDYAFWNMCTPWPGTRVHDWFNKHGTIGDVRNFSTLIDSELDFQLPRAWTPDFTQEQRIKAWLSANLETYVLPVNWGRPLRAPFLVIKLLRLSWKYGVCGSAIKYFLGFIPRRLMSIWKRHIMRRMVEGGA